MKFCTVSYKFFYSEEVNQLKQLLAEQKQSNLEEYKIEKIVTAAKHDVIAKVIKTARYPYSLIKDETEKEYTERIR
jgi:hypothetical protein